MRPLSQPEGLRGAQRTDIKIPPGLEGKLGECRDKKQPFLSDVLLIPKSRMQKGSPVEGEKKILLARNGLL